MGDSKKKFEETYLKVKEKEIEDLFEARPHDRRDAHAARLVRAQENAVARGRTIRCRDGLAPLLDAKDFAMVQRAQCLVVCFSNHR